MALCVYVTMEQLKYAGACKRGMRVLRTGLCLRRGEDVLTQRVPLWLIAQTNGVNDALWALRAVRGKRRLMLDFLSRVQQRFNLKRKEYADHNHHELAVVARDICIEAVGDAYAAGDTHQQMLQRRREAWDGIKIDFKDAFGGARNPES